MQFRFKNIIKQLTADKTNIIIVLSILGLVFALLLSSCASKVQSLQPKSTGYLVVPTATVPKTTAAPTTTMPDLSGVDWTALSRAKYGKCGEYHDLAIQAGWPESQWSTLSYVMYRESRCNTLAHNKFDANGGSRGLIQINGYWCKKSRYSANGWLQDKSILNTCDDLYQPLTNLRAGWAMWQYSQEHNRCGWRPWSTRCK